MHVVIYCFSFLILQIFLYNYNSIIYFLLKIYIICIFISYASYICFIYCINITMLYTLHNIFTNIYLLMSYYLKVI